MTRRRKVVWGRVTARAPRHLGPSDLEWTIHLAARDPRRAALLVGLIVGCALLCFYLFGSLPFAMFTALALVAATAEFLLPVRYRLSPGGAEMRNLHNWRRIAWTDVRKVYLAEGEIKLSPLPHGGPREAFRGVVLRVGSVDPATQPSYDELVLFIRRRMTEADPQVPS